MSRRGLQQREARKRLKEYGYNEIIELSRVSPLKILLKQIKNNVVIYLLFIATIISFLVNEFITGYAIFGALMLAILLGFAQEFRAEKAIKALEQMIVPTTTVIRDGKEEEIPSKEIVLGDILVLKTGEKIPADCVIIEEKELKVNEAILTGESREIRKYATNNLESSKNENLLFMGTFIISGKCVAKVIHTGMNTEFGKIAKLISTTERELPLQTKINHVAKYMVAIAIIGSTLVGLIIILRSPSLSYTIFADVLIVVIALSVSAFPEGFSVALIMTLATGAHRMAKKNAIVNRLSIIETLGETTIICADKTGTITKGEMTVKKILVNDKIYDVGGIGYQAVGEFFYHGEKINIATHPNLALMLKTAILCNDAKVRAEKENKEYIISGTPTEAALLVAAAKANIFRDGLEAIRMEELPFTSERKVMAVLCKEGSKYFTYAKGAPEVMLKKCEYIQKDNNVIWLSEKERKSILAANKKLTSDAFRTLAIAYKKVESKGKTNIEEHLIFLGIMALEDPPRNEIKASISLCRSAGIKVKLVTGDNKETALAIAKQIGLPGKAIGGEELDMLTDDELSKIVNDVTIFTRVRPEHKLRIVKALKQNGEIVTMTGDGVNDAPALKEAHIGVAMGKGGTDISRETADLVLKDDNFATIVSAISEGRTIFSNIRKFITYELSCNYAEMFVILVGVLAGLPLILLALQILFMNLVTDDLPSIMLSLNPPSLDVMEAKPRKKSGILNKQLFGLLALAGTVMGVGTLGVFQFIFNITNQNLTVARTTTLVTLILFEIANAFNFRSFRSPVYKLPFFANKYLVYASILSILATVMIIYSPLNSIFNTTPIGFKYWIFAFLVSLSIIAVFDILKTANEKYRFLAIH